MSQEPPPQAVRLSDALTPDDRLRVAYGCDLTNDTCDYKTFNREMAEQAVRDGASLSGQLVHTAVLHHDPDFLRFLIENKVPLGEEATRLKWTPLVSQSRSCYNVSDIEKLKLLIEGGADINRIGYYGDCALPFSIETYAKTLVKSIDEQKRIASLLVQKEAIRVLCEAGAQLRHLGYEAAMEKRRGNPRMRTAERLIALALGTESAASDLQDLTDFLSLYWRAEREGLRIFCQEEVQDQKLEMNLYGYYPPSYTDDRFTVRGAVAALQIAIEAHPDGRRTHRHVLEVLKEYQRAVEALQARHAAVPALQHDGPQ